MFDSCVDVSSVVNNSYSVIFDAFNRFVPLCNSYTSNCQSQYPHKIRRLLYKKSTAWKQYRTFRTQELSATYKSITSQCRSAHFSLSAEVENKVIDPDNINQFYRYAYGKFINKSLIGPLKSNDVSILPSAARAFFL